MQAAFEKGVHERMQHAFQMSHAHVPANQQALDLVKHRRVGLVRITSVHLARRDNPVRRRTFFHHPDLHGRGVRAQQPAITEIEGIVHGACRVVRREIEQFEIVVVVFNLGAGCDIETQPGENADRPFHGHGDRVQATALFTPPRQRDIHFLFEQLFFECRAFQGLPAGQDGLVHGIPNHVNLLPVRLALLRLHRAQGFQLPGDLAFLAEIADAQIIQLLQVGAG